jgi:hypothetical protein
MEMNEKQRRLDRFPEIPVRDWNFGSTWQLPIRAYWLLREQVAIGPLSRKRMSAMTFSLRKEVIQPQVLLRLPCYDFTPIMNYTLGGCFLAVSAPTSSTTHFRDVTGGVYKARERIHRGVLIRDY